VTVLESTATSTPAPRAGQGDRASRLAGERSAGAERARPDRDKLRAGLGWALWLALLTEPACRDRPVVDEPGPPPPIVLAALQGDVARIQALHGGGADINAHDADGYTVLMGAVQSGRLEAVEEVLRLGGDAGARTKGGWTVLALAADLGRADVAGALIASGADVNAHLADGGMTALTLASWQGHGAVVRVLLEAGADVDASADNGNTPLVFAASEGHDEIVSALIAAGADVDKRGLNGTPLEYALAAGQATTAEILRRAGGG
jgi:uncharacterized protein